MIPIARPHLPPLEHYVELLEEIWETRMLSNFSDFAYRLEDMAKRYLDASHVLAVSSADIGLIVTLKALGLPPGAPCYVSDFTFNSTINAAIWAGLRPVLVDIDPGTYNMSLTSLHQATESHDSNGVVLATHVFGNPCDVESLSTVAREVDCFLVFDAAHAYGSKRGGRHVGTFGDAEIFSLSGTKLVTSAEGGLIATPHQWLAERIVHLRAYGFQGDYVSREVGLNGKISELHCALGILTLAEVEKAVERRSQILEGYRGHLGELVGWQQVDAADRSTFKDISIRLGDERDVVEKVLNEAGVQTKRYFLPLHEMELYSKYAEVPLPNASDAYRTTLCVPSFWDITDDEVEFVCERILEALE